jgi:hypothetical protein
MRVHVLESIHLLRINRIINPSFGRTFPSDLTHHSVPATVFKYLFFPAYVDRTPFESYRTDFQWKTRDGTAKIWKRRMTAV